MASNPAAEDVDLVLYSLANVTWQLRGGPPLPPPRSPPTPFVFRQANSANAKVRETRKAMHEHRPTSRLVGVTEGYPDSIHDLLCDEEPLSDASSMGDNYRQVLARLRACVRWQPHRAKGHLWSSRPT